MSTLIEVVELAEPPAGSMRTVTIGKTVADKLQLE